MDFSFPEPTSYSHGRIFRKSEITLEHALLGLPKACAENKPLTYEMLFNDDWANSLKSKNNTVTEHILQNIEETQLERISKLKQGQTMKDLPEHLQHPSFKKRAARRVMDGTPSEKRGGAPSGLKRLRLDDPSLTITGAAVREFIHPLENRCLTIRECARIQTFPDDFIFCGSSGDKIQQIGNAIPPLLAKAFAKHIMKLGFEIVEAKSNGELLGFTLSKSEGLSPALQKTKNLLSKLIHNNLQQLSVFQDAY
jgi:DNA (cytosine-5)-methyltransferase 1